jgi:hypothetical protein
VNDENLHFLNNFLNWLDTWNSLSLKTGILTKETFFAISHTTYALIEICNYCFSELQMDYVLLGKFQTDILEARFGLYRQLAGAQYNVSVRQVFEVEKKLRMSSILKAQIKKLYL